MFMFENLRSHSPSNSGCGFKCASDQNEEALNTEQLSHQPFTKPASSPQ